jgi:RimJ/RimL family protein N-acetyltransferase
MGNHRTKDGRQFKIRRPDEHDAENIINYSRQLFASTDQVLTTPEEYDITPEHEKIWINNINRSTASLLLIADVDNKIAGMLFFIQNAKRKNAHTGEFGVSVHPEFQGIGIGRQLITTLLNWAKNNSSIEKVYLNVFATNKKAIELYRGLGFIEEGRHVKAVKQVDGRYVDVLQMYVETKEQH